jgi:hypothetical protein
MKGFIARFLLFFAPILLLLYGADVFISKNLIKSNFGEGSVWRDIYTGKVNSDIVIYGASRALQHIDPKIITDTLHQSSYNLGIEGYPFEMQYLRHRLFLKHNKKPRIIILSLDFLTFQKRADLYDIVQYLPYMLYDTLVRKYTQNYIGFTQWDYFIPLVRYYRQGVAVHRSVSLFKHKTPEPDDRVKGYYSEDKKYAPIFNDGPGDHDFNYKIKFDATAIKLFNDFLQECKKDHIQVILVYTPEYIAGQNFVKNRSEMFKLIDQFSKKYQVPLFDYSADRMCTDSTYFYNSEHLNKTGAQLFSKKFAGDLKRYLNKGGKRHDQPQ